jgi:hypothetical protein
MSLLTLFDYFKWSNLRQRFVEPLPFHGRLRYKLAYLKARSQQKQSLTILCYPKRPQSPYVLYKLAHLAGCRITDNPNAHYDLVVRFEDTTFANFDEVLSTLAKRTRVINLHCTDISKKRVNLKFARVFGYSLTVDPLTYAGKCSMKSDKNFAKDSKVITCPIAEVTPGYVYQRLVNNQMGTLVQDIRVPVVGKKIPFVYIVYKSLKDRFNGKDAYVEIAETHDVFSAEEVSNLIRFCQEFGLDYGELDALRDVKSGLIYVVDANNTPTGPARRLSEKEREDALFTLTETFKETFLCDVEAGVRTATANAAKA